MIIHSPLSTSLLSFLAGLFTLHYANTNTFDLFYVYLGLAYIVCLYLFNTQDANIGQRPKSNAIMTEQITENKKILYFMFAPWCTYSKKAMPLWEKIKEKYKDDSTLSLKLLNSEDDKEAMKPFKISSFPTFVLEKEDGTIHRFKGERTVQGISAFVRKY